MAKQAIFRLGRWMARLLAAVLLAALFGLAVVMAQPQSGLQEEPVTDQPLKPYAAAQQLSEATPLEKLCADFPVAALVSGSDQLLLQSGVLYDTAFEDGFARVLRLEYLYGDTPVTVTGIYPRRAVSLLADTALELTGQGASLAGEKTARMEGEGRLRLQMQTADGLYSVELPQSAEPELSVILKALRLEEKTE